MAFFYRGAGPGSYWHSRDPFHLGFTPYCPGQTPSTSRMIRHIARGSVMSPYISFSRSYAVGRAYAMVGPRGFATPNDPGWVYELEISDDQICKTMDPIKEIAQSLPLPWQDPNYHHDGEQLFLLGVVDPVGMRDHLQAQCLFPPGSAGTPRPPHLSEELEALVRAIRDAEILISGNIPASTLRRRYEIV